MENVRVRRHIMKNRIYIYISGFLSIKDVENLKDKVTRALAKTRPPFGIIVYQRKLGPLKGEAKEIATNIMKAASDKGCKKVIRIVGENVVARMQQERIIKDERLRYSVEFAKSVKDAEKMLDKDQL